jgi:outer membrane protein assembly factor BamB
MAKCKNIIWVPLIVTMMLMHVSSTMRANEPFWPQFRGPNCSGIAAEGQNPPVKFGSEQNLLWKTSVPLGHSSPCIWADHIFLTGYNKEKKELHVFCIDRSSGNIRWSRIVPAKQIEKLHPVNNPAASTPATDGERVYAYFGSCGLLCYDFRGELLWTVPLPIAKTTDGHSTSPIVSGELVILNRDEKNGPHLLAVNCRTGETVWKQPQPIDSELGTTSHSTPVVWGQQLVLHLGGELVAYNAADGTRIWSVSINTRGTSTPIIGDKIFYVAAWSNLGEPDLRVDVPDFETMLKQYDKNGDMKISNSEFPGDLMVARRPEVGEIEGGQIYLKPFFRMIDANSDNSIDVDEWKEITVFISALQKEHGLVAIKPKKGDDPNTPEVLWSQTRSVPEVPSPLYYNGHVYMVKNGGIISCMNAENGKLLFRKRLGAFGPYYSSPVCANGKIYIASGKGIITVFSAGDHLQILARNNLREPIFATPAIVENKLYVRTVKYMYAFGE